MAVLWLLPRLAYFAVVPFILVVSAAVVPIGGLIFDLALLLIGLAVIEALRGLSERSRIVRAVTRRQREFAAYYEAHPPRSFAYYLFFPLLLPVILVRRDLRAEIGLYRGFTRVGLLVLVGHAGLEYATVWAPELPFGEFFASTIGSLVIQAIALFAFIIPLAATVVTYHLRSDRRAVRLLLGAAALSVAFAFLAQSGRRRAEVQAPVKGRVELRAELYPERTAAAQDAALRLLWADLEAGAATLEADGLVDDAATARARQALLGVYREDEAEAFNAHAWPPDAPTVAILQAPMLGGRAPVWRARSREGAAILDKDALPPEIYDVDVTRSRPHR